MEFIKKYMDGKLDCVNTIPDSFLFRHEKSARGGRGVLPMMTYYMEAPPERVTYFRLQVYEGVGI